MRPEQRTKSRSKLYNAISGALTHVGASGVMSRWTIAFANLAAATDVVIVGGVYFQYVADGSEDTPLDSAGTSADPHLITIGGTPTATTAAANLVTALLAETATTGKWGFLYPDDSVGASNSTGTVTINFWPGTSQNATTYVVAADFVGTDPTVTNTVTGVASKIISAAYSVNLLDTTGSAQNKELYVMPDGELEGDTMTIAIKDNDGSDTPTLLGKLSDAGTSNVEALFATDEPGMYGRFMWIASEWHLQEEGFGTALAFTASA